jgi:Predicted transcriptional regulators
MQMIIQYPTIGSRIKECRKNSGLTQSQLGEVVGVSGTAIMRYETDQREPKTQMIFDIARALDVDPAYLLCVTEEKGPYSLNLFTYGVISNEQEEMSKKERVRQTKQYEMTNNNPIALAKKKHLEVVDDVCTERSALNPEDYEDQLKYMASRIEIVTRFIENNYHFLQSVMPGFKHKGSSISHGEAESEEIPDNKKTSQDQHDPETKE